MRAIFSLLLSRRAPPAEAAVAAALADFLNPAGDALELIRRLVVALRPRRGETEGAKARYRAMVDQLEADPALAGAFRQHVVHFLASRRLVSFFTDSGILPGTGFFSEWWRIIGHRLLPEVPDDGQLKDCLHVIFDHADDWRWLAAVPTGDSRRFWRLVGAGSVDDRVDWEAIRRQMLDATFLLAHRISGLGVDGEMARVSPDAEADLPRFVALSVEALAYVSGQRAALDDPARSAEDGSHLLVIADQCQEVVNRIRKRALTFGTSLHLSFQLVRIEQSLARLRDLVGIIDHWAAPAAAREEVAQAWADFARAAFLAENRRNSLGYYLGELSHVLALRVTENAARSGEHYICESRAAYRQMWWSAAGGGVFIGGMALLKILASMLHSPPLIEAFLFSLIYGLGFVLIYLLGLTVATKQPAMTAQTLASLLGDLRATRQAELERLVDVVAAVCRSQLAAIAGNVMLAFPVALALGWGLAQWTGEPVIPPGKAATLIDDLDILSWALIHASIAGGYLFLSGLLTGYVDNLAAYGDIGRRVGRLRGLRRLLGAVRAERLGRALQGKLGGITGNFLFGCMLGATGTFGLLLGLPLDIRHIAFSSANLGYAMTGFQFSLLPSTVLWAALGVAAIGLTNLAVSFGLALRTALRARGVTFDHWGALLGAIGRRLRVAPRDFFLPPRAGDQAAP